MPSIKLHRAKAHEDGTMFAWSAWVIADDGEHVCIEYGKSRDDAITRARSTYQRMQDEGDTPDEVIPL